MNLRIYILNLIKEFLGMEAVKTHFGYFNNPPPRF